MSEDHLSTWTEAKVRERIVALTDFQRKVFEEEKAKGKSDQHAFFLAKTYAAHILPNGRIKREKWIDVKRGNTSRELEAIDLTEKTKPKNSIRKLIRSLRELEKRCKTIQNMNNFYLETIKHHKESAEKLNQIIGDLKPILITIMEKEESESGIALQYFRRSMGLAAKDIPANLLEKRKLVTKMNKLLDEIKKTDKEEMP